MLDHRVTLAGDFVGRIDVAAREAAVARIAVDGFAAAVPCVDRISARAGQS